MFYSCGCLGSQAQEKWLFISSIPLHSKMLSFVWIRWRFGAINEWCFVICCFFFFLLYKQTICSARHGDFSSFCFPAGDMLDLLKWRAHPDRINDSLSKLKEIDGSEIVKVAPKSHSQLWFAQDLISVQFCLTFSEIVWKLKVCSSLTVVVLPVQVSAGHSGHSVWYFRRELPTIRAQSVRFSSECIFLLPFCSCLCVGLSVPLEKYLMSHQSDVFRRS